MWLYYYYNVLKELVAIFDESNEAIDHTNEWPTRASYLIYTIFSNLVGWVELIDDLSSDSSHRTVESLLPRHENDKIPKSAGLVLGLCLKVLLPAQTINQSFRSYIYEIVMRSIRDLGTEGDHGRMRTVMIKSIVGCGPLGPDKAYGAVLVDFWHRTDDILKAELEDYEAALLEAYG